MGVGGRACLWSACLGVQSASGKFFSAVADALQLEFIPDGNNEEVLAGWREGPSPWGLQRKKGSPAWRALIPSAQGLFP